MNYKKDISLNSCKVTVEFTFSTLLILVFTICLIAILSIKYLEQFLYCRTLQMDLFTRSTSISYLIYVEIFFLKVDNKFSIIVCFRTLVYSSKIGRQVYIRDRETRPGSVISLTLERAPLQPFQESTYPRIASLII